MPTRIDWCDETINPLGFWCFGPGGTQEKPMTCDYCYAKRMAQRKMVKCEKCHTFNVPHTHFEQLDKLQHWQKPRNIFIQSMGDLFHETVPDSWIEDVFRACEAAPQHRYLFLTKNPKRYQKTLDRYFPPNMWFGWSQTGPVDNELGFSTHHSVKTFISLEPLLTPFEVFNIRGIDWAIVGAETGNRKGKVIPKREWIVDIVRACKNNEIPVFMKSSLRDLMGDDFIQQYPWEDKK